MPSEIKTSEKIIKGKRTCAKYEKTHTFFFIKIVKFKQNLK